MEWIIGAGLLIVVFILFRRYILAIPSEPSHDTRDVSLDEIMGALPRPLIPMISGGKQRMKLSWVRRIVTRYVDETSPTSSPEQKIKLIEAFIVKVKATGAYDFVDQ